MSDPTATDRVAIWTSGDAVYFAALPRGPITVLRGTAFTIWQAANAGAIGDVADRVAPELGLQADEIRAPVDEFVDRLVSQGLIPRSQ